MNLFETLKQFKKIEPDAAFKESSKRAIFALAPRAAVAPVARMRMTILKIFETAAAVALTGFFILIITGAFSGGGITPQYEAVNPGALRAEAQAIDIQIQLAKLNYSAPAGGQSTISAVQVTTSTTSGVETTTVSVEAAPGSATTTATTTVTIDQALQNLAK